MHRVLQGELQLSHRPEASVARTGQLVCLRAGEPWEVRAAVDSLFLLIVGRPPQLANESSGPVPSPAS
jgi:hypothetical protein